MPKSEETNETFWFPTPQEPGYEAHHTAIQKRRLQELKALQNLEQLNPQDNQESRKQFLSNFHWTGSKLDMAARKAIEELLVEFHDIFVRHRFNIGINNDFKIKLTPIDESLAYSQNLPTLINLKEGIALELALLHKYISTALLPHCHSVKTQFQSSRKENQTVTYVSL